MKINFNLNSTNLYGILSLSIVLVLTILFVGHYWLKTRNRPVHYTPTGFILLVDLLLVSLQRMIDNTLGKRFRFLTPYALFLLVYINFGNLVSLLGFDSPLTFIVVPLSLGLITFLGIYLFGIMFRRWAYFKRFLNPLELIAQFAPLISISFRIFGNLMAGFFVMFLLYKNMNNLVGELKYFNLLAILAAPLHIYFDIFSGVIQSFIFLLLTFTYWSFERPTSVQTAKNNSYPRLSCII